MARKRQTPITSDLTATPQAVTPNDGSEPAGNVTPFDTRQQDDRGEQSQLPDNATIVRVIDGYRREAYDAKRWRMRVNHANRDAYINIQDWSHKQKGQSTEFLPKIATAAEQFSAFVKKSLTQFDDWFSVDQSQESKPYITDGQIRNLMKYYLAKLPDGVGKFSSFETRIADAAKVGLLESLMIFKVYWKDVKVTTPYVEPGGELIDLHTGRRSSGPPTLKRKTSTRGHLCIDLIRTEDYFPDPTGRGLYEIHEVERDYFDVLDMAEQGVYDLETVKQIKEDFPKSEFEKRRPQQMGQIRSPVPAGRKRILLTEFWGTLLSPTGEVIAENVICTVANKKYLIRPPEPNPFWHGESPFIARPLIRVPFSVWHKALYDGPAQLNFALNELFNLMLDGGIASVWGVRQLRANHLADPKQVSNGIPQGTTLVVNDTLPEGAKVLETVASGEVPPSAMEMFEAVNQEFNEAALTNSMRLGSLPARPVKATEVVQVQQSQDVTLDSVASDLEDMIEEILTKSWFTILQHMDDIDQKDLVSAVGKQAAVLITSISDAERYLLFSAAAAFNVKGLTATMAAVQDFQKLMALLQAIATNPMLMQAFITQFDPRRIIKLMMKHMNINPDDIAMTPDQLKALPQILQQMAMFAQMFGGGSSGQAGGGGAMSAEPGSAASPFLSPPGGQMSGQGAAMTAGVNQTINPLAGLSPTGGIPTNG